MAGPLKGIKVLDLSRILAGPWSTQMLADFGAEVIKVEKPGAGDDTRQWGPPFLVNSNGEQSDAAYFLSANRGKKSVEIDISSELGQKQVAELLRDCDVLVENFKLNGLMKYKLDYDSVKKLNPKIIYCSITGFGQTGPHASKAGYDLAIQGFSGLMSITGEADDVPGGGPQKVGVAVVDIITGLYAANAIQAALIHREHSGKGQFIDLALLDCMVAALANQNMNYLIGGKAPQRYGTGHPNIVPYQAFKAADGALILAIGNDRQFRSFCKIAELPTLSCDPRFATNAARVANREELIPLIEKQLLSQSRQYWLECLGDRNIPCSPINDIEEMFNSPQVSARDLVKNIETQNGTKIPSVANPINFSETPIEYKVAPPKLGEHNDEFIESD